MTTDPTAALVDDPRVQPDAYVVHPTGYAAMTHPDKNDWCLTVVNGHMWGWAIRRGIDVTGSRVMNGDGTFTLEMRTDLSNKDRRWPLNDALAIALQHVDSHRIGKLTAAEADAEFVRDVLAQTTQS